MFPAIKLLANATFILTLFCFFSACQNAPQSKESEPGTSTHADTSEAAAVEVEEEQLPELENKTLLYAWVDPLNIRDKPTSKGKLVKQVTSQDALVFTGEKSETKETIVLRGVAYEDVWLKVVSPDKKEGWVFGGTVKRQGEKKGNTLISEQQFNFPHFGEFDLSSWQKIKEEEGGGGDAETVAQIYKKGNQILEIEHHDVGEYGYGYSYKLKDGSGKLQKERTFDFNTDVDLLEIVEIVKDYSSKPPKQYSRNQKLNTHFIQMNARPVMAKGPWTTSALAVNATEATKAAQVTLEVFTNEQNIPATIDLDSGCSCSFRSHPNDYKTTFFQSTFEDVPKAKAVIQLDGAYIVLQSAKFPHPDYKRGDYHAYYFNDQYELRIVAFEDGKDDGGGKKYSGTIKLNRKDGTVLCHLNTFGSCGC